MFKFGVMVLLLVYFSPTSAATCDSCKSTYGTPVAGAKCVALKTYLFCLETSAKGDTGCPLPTADAATIETDYTGDTCSASFTDTCVCQKEFWKTDQSTGDAAVCSAAQTYIACLKGKTAMACDGTSTVITLATGVESRMNALTTPACAITTACQCEIDAAKADISDDAKKCTAYKAQFACLYSLTTAPCVSGTTIDALRSAAALSVTSTASCTVTTACQCELDAAKADISTDAKKCIAYKAQFACLYSLTTAPCVSGTTIDVLRSAAATSVTSTASCTVTTACQCEIDAAKADISTDAKKCIAYKAQFACLYSLTTAPCVSGTTIDALRSAAALSVTSTASCTVTTACQCEIDAAKADISTDAKKCTAYKAQYACLYPLTTDPCAGGTTIAELKTAVANSVTTTTSCNFDTCVCQRTFDAATKGNDEEKCTAYKAELSCLSTAQSTGCDGTTNKSAIATASESARALLPTGDCPALTSTCQCEVNAAKGDASTSATYCTVLTTLKTCLSAITTTTEAGCTSTTQADLLTDTNDKITAATCGSAADYVTFATTSLIVSVLVNMFL
ncbi:uncharacterized protein LOC124126175 isoform X2 [Haliotis rufescens]|uniref:uncharacterized protein LOC124126175 isoform X2 n=1 Tax=Haliotis rufescens TaxID=6454 RepID=UPI00201F2AC9|nr:uncharacterized protein LOC124126175 isoform X2 [Haliotis rufescens]